MGDTYTQHYIQIVFVVKQKQPIILHPWPQVRNVYPDFLVLFDNCF